MQLVRIAGPTEEMRRLAEVEGLDFERTSANRLDDDTWQVSGYATDEALAELDTRGLTTELVVPAAKVEEERTVLFASITRDEDPEDATAGAPPDATPSDDPPAASPSDDPTGASPGDKPPANSPSDDPPAASPSDDPPAASPSDDGGEA
jgi:hypothetical protein